MKILIKLLVVLSTIPILAQNNNMNFKLIKSSELRLQEFNSIEQLDYNLAIVYIRPDGNFVIYPQKGNYSIIVDSKEELKEIVNNNYFPLLDDNKSLYLNASKITVDNNGIVVNDTILISQLKVKFGLNQSDINEETIKTLESQFLKLSKNNQQELFAELLFLFGEHLREKLQIKWIIEKEFYLHPISIPILYNEELNISLYDLNINLEKQILKAKVNFKKLLIDVYCQYYNKRFLSTGQYNYFDSKEYQKLLNQDFDKFWKFPFVDIWNSKDK